MIRLGDYVNAKLVAEEGRRQGVFTVDNGDGTIVVEGENEIFVCEGPATAALVEDKDVFRPETKQHIRAVRRRLSIAR